MRGNGQPTRRKLRIASMISGLLYSYFRKGVCSKPVDSKKVNSKHQQQYVSGADDVGGIIDDHESSSGINLDSCLSLLVAERPQCTCGVLSSHCPPSKLRAGRGRHCACRGMSKPHKLASSQRALECSHWRSGDASNGTSQLEKPHITKPQWPTWVTSQWPVSRSQPGWGPLCLTSKKNCVGEKKSDRPQRCKASPRCCPSRLTSACPPSALLAPWALALASLWPPSN